MRTNIVAAGADELSYEIREIVDFGKKVEALGQSLIWENIGDPVAKGEKIPPWIKELIAKALTEDKTFAYSPTKGLLETRQFLSEFRRAAGDGELDPEDILFFNGLGDAVSKVYTNLNENARVIGPSPAYPTHSSAEAAHAGSHHLTYELNPARNWLPDINDLRNKVQYNQSIAGILIINPDNPTGMIYPKSILKEIISIARDYDLFLICDEIYANIEYGDDEFVPLSRLLDGVPAIVMRGLSKEVPWPGARCGWIEVYNKDTDPVFARYIKSINDAKMLEVCSTTLPQRVLPEIFKDPRYKEYLKSRRSAYSSRAALAHKALRNIEGASVVKPGGAFYLTLTFDVRMLTPVQTLPVANAAVRKLLDDTVASFAPNQFDKRFAYYLMAAYGLCVVPLSGFNTHLQGFRMTLLEEDPAVFKKTLDILGEAIPAYLRS
jgi:aspartate/methionine/tyrosine aminotransferase